MGTIHNTIKNGLHNFEEKILETDEHFENLKRLGRYDPLAPYDGKYHLFFLIEKLGDRDPSYLTFKTEYNRILKKLDDLEKKRGNKYREMLFEYFIQEVKGYQGIIDYFGDPDDLDFGLEMPNDFLHRDSLEILLMELKNDFDLKDYEVKIQEMDAHFKEKIFENIERMLERCPYLEQPDYPERFWWWHSSIILAEKARLKQ